jgi:transcriptional regulator with XRE-family HTH domain
MKFRTMQENLRQILLERIESRDLTGLQLSQQTGFRQAHVSNFLNRKRGLSLEGMDRVLRVLKLSALDLLDPKEINQHASILPPSSGDFQNVLLVSSAHACEPHIINRKVKEIFKFRKSFLNNLRPGLKSDDRKKWERFLLIRVERNQGMSMLPRLEPGTIALIDRHYNSLRPYRNGEPNLYAVHNNGHCSVRYVEQNGEQLFFRPLNVAYPVEVVAMSGKKTQDCVIGRVCYVGSEV